MASSFSRQLKFAQVLVDSLGRLTAEALLDGRFENAKSMAVIFGRAKKFRSSNLWYGWKCSTYEIFVKKFYECCDKGLVEV